jgi:hypothetical protein
LVTIIGIDAWTGTIASTSGKVEELMANSFRIRALSPQYGTNGSPVVNSSGEIVAMQIEGPGNRGKVVSIGCVRVPKEIPKLVAH